MKQIVNNTNHKTVDINSFDPYEKDEKNFLKPIGMEDKFQTGDKGFLMHDGHRGSTFSAISCYKLEGGNCWGARIDITKVKEYIKEELGGFNFYVFDSSRELIEWLANK